MNHGDHLLYELALKAGMTYGETLVSVSAEFHEANTLDVWGMEVWTKFEVDPVDGATRFHYLPGHPATLVTNALHESTTIPVEW